MLCKTIFPSQISTISKSEKAVTILKILHPTKENKPINVLKKWEPNAIDVIAKYFITVHFHKKKQKFKYISSFVIFDL